MQPTRAIVLQQIKYSESSLIVKAYTQSEGLLSFIVKGVRGKKGKLRSAQFQALNLLELSYKKGKKSSLSIITDLKISEPFTELLYQPIKRSIAMFMAELIYQSIKEEEPNHELFNFLYNSIHWLDLTKEPCTHFHLLFMMKLTRFIGFEPNKLHLNKSAFFDLEQGLYTDVKPTHNHFIEKELLNAWTALIQCEFTDIATLKFSNPLKRSLIETLMDYYKLHLVHFKDLNSHHILQQVFNDE